MIDDKNFLKFLEAKRNIRRRRKQIINNLFTIEKNYILRNAFIETAFSVERILFKLQNYHRR